MTQRSLSTYLDSKPPGYVVDSAFEVSTRFRLAESTVRSSLEASGFKQISGRWIKQETQLDRIERLLLAQAPKHLPLAYE